MWRGGDDKSGYQVWVDRARRILRFRFWGLWDEPTGQGFRDAALLGMRQLGAAGSWKVLADISNYPPQKPEVQKFHAELMEKAPKLGCIRAANLVDNALSAMQIRRLSEQSGLPDFSFFRTEAEALRWLTEDAEALGPRSSRPSR